MGLFDIFRSRIKDLGDSLDEDALTADEDTTEAKAALSKKEDIIEQHCKMFLLGVPQVDQLVSNCHP